MKLIHTHLFIKSNDSAATINYGQVNITSVSEIHQYGFSGDLTNVHELWPCAALKTPNPSDSYKKKVKIAKLVFFCLRSGHPLKDCKNNNCGKRTQPVASQVRFFLKANYQSNCSLYSTVDLVFHGLDQKYLGRLAEFAWCKSKSYNQWFFGIENHDTKLVHVTIKTEDCRSQNLRFPIHKILVIGDTCYYVKRIKQQHSQLANVSAENLGLGDVRVIPGTDCFSITRPLEY